MRSSIKKLFDKCKEADGITPNPECYILINNEHTFKYLIPFKLII